MEWKALGQCSSPVHTKYIGTKKIKMAFVSNVLELLLILKSLGTILLVQRWVELDHGCVLSQVDIVCGDHLLEHYQTLREIRQAIGESAVQVRVAAGALFWDLYFKIEDFVPKLSGSTTCLKKPCGKLTSLCKMSFIL